jgi:hypothetical protein
LYRTTGQVTSACTTIELNSTTDCVTCSCRATRQCQCTAVKARAITCATNERQDTTDTGIALPALNGKRTTRTC